MTIQILDCTLRDGGYLVGKNYPPSFIQNVMRALIKAKIDYIEVGFLQNAKKEENVIYHNAQEAKVWLPEDRQKSQFTGFADNSRYSIDNLEPCDGASFENVRICFAKYEYQDALKFAKAAIEKGYIIFVQPMDVLGYTKEELLRLVESVNEISPECLSIVDTFGAMYLDDLRTVFEWVNGHLSKSIKMGFHSHNNMNLSAALAQEFIGLATKADRNIVVDTSLLGMGRGAGNAQTEVMTKFLNEKYHKDYDMDAILEVIAAEINPLKAHLQWGYSLPMFICGCLSSHVDNVYHLAEKGDVSATEMYHIIESMDVEKRKRYDFLYSKSDFTELDNAIQRYRDKK